MYKVFNGKNWLLFNTYEQLLNWLSQHNHFFGNNFRNPFLESTGVNDNDVHKAFVEFKGIASIFSSGYMVEYVKRVNRILNEDGHNIYDKLLINDVKNWVYSDRVAQEWRDWVNRDRKVTRYRGYTFLKDSEYPGFRSGPWPYIRKRRGGSGCYRSIHTTNEIRQSADPEHKQFNRGTRGLNLPTLWDEGLRDWRNDGWKKQGKNRHQWELRVKTKCKHKYGKGIFVCKELNVDGIDDYYDDINVIDGIAE